MGATLNDLEASMNITNIQRYYNYSNTSDINMPLITNASGLTGIKESIYTEKGIIYDSFKSFEDSELFREEFLIKPEKIYYPEVLGEIKSFEPPPKEVISASLSLIFSEKIENLININTTFRKWISQIEIGLNNFIEIKNINMESSIFFEEDWEIPDYEKIVLFLNFKGIPFNQELSLWKFISKIIYDRIKSLILISSEVDSRKIKEWKKRFFIKLNM